MIWLWLSLASLPILLLTSGVLTCTSNTSISPCSSSQEKPLFIVPHGATRRNAEDVKFPTTHGLYLRGCYLRSNKPRRGSHSVRPGVRLQSLVAVPYCEFLLEDGYDVFSFETRGQGQSEPGGLRTDGVGHRI